MLRAGHLAGAMITSPASVLVTDTSVGESQPMDTTAAYSACPSGTSALATACWICWTMSSLSNWEVNSCTLASSLSGTATSLTVPPAVVTVMVSTSSKSTEPVESPVVPGVHAPRAAGRADRGARIGARIVAGRVVSTGTEHGDEQEGGQDGSEKAAHSHGTVAPRLGFRQAARVPPGFTKGELESFRDAEVPDLLPGPGQPLRLLFVGINPGLWTAAVQTHFAHPGNRFYPALLEAGIIERPIDPAAGMTDTDRDYLRARGIGITNIVRRATARADELSADELRDGRSSGWTATGRADPPGGRGDRRHHGVPDGVRARGAVVGRQPVDLAGAELWVVAEPERAQRPRDGRRRSRRRTPRPRVRPA